METLNITICKYGNIIYYVMFALDNKYVCNLQLAEL